MMTRAPMGTTLPACTLTHHTPSLRLRLLFALCAAPSCQGNLESLSWSESSPIVMPSLQTWPSVRTSGGLLETLCDTGCGRSSELLCVRKQLIATCNCFTWMMATLARINRRDEGGSPDSNMTPPPCSSCSVHPL